MVTQQKLNKILREPKFQIRNSNVQDGGRNYL